MDLINKINHKVNSPLSASDLMKLCPGVKIVTYDELHKLRDIDEILHPLGKVFILYMNGESFGHWTCLYVREGILNFFDSYGGKVDNFSIFKYIPNHIIERKHQEFNYLADLMLHSRYNRLSYNDIRLQGSNTATCGRYCALRLTMDCSDEDFAKFCRGKKPKSEIYKKYHFTPDMYVTYLTLSFG